MVRCFVGYLIPEGLKNNIISVQQEIAKWPLVCKFVEKDNLHLNFSFLGEVGESEIDTIKTKLDHIASETKKFDVFIGGIRAIPNENYIRVLALEVGSDSNNMEPLFSRIKDEIGGDVKPAHLTLCRVKTVSDKSFVRKKIEMSNEARYGKFTIESIQLIKSELSKSGPVYSVIHESKFIN
jgi:2'-5' RNA ligase